MCAWFLQTSFCVSFPFAEFALYPFAVINPNFVYNYILHSVSSSLEYLKLGMVLGIPYTAIQS